MQTDDALCVQAHRDGVADGRRDDGVHTDTAAAAAVSAAAHAAGRGAGAHHRHVRRHGGGSAATPQPAM